MIGKFRRALSKKCPYCGSKLQVRTMEEEVIRDGYSCSVDIEYIVCQNDMCDYEERIEPRRRRREEQE